MKLMVEIPAEEVTELTLVSAYECAVFDSTEILADLADDIASRVLGDDRIKNPQLRKQVAKEAAAVLDEAKALMSDIKTQDTYDKK